MRCPVKYIHSCTYSFSPQRLRKFFPTDHRSGALKYHSIRPFCLPVLLCCVCVLPNSQCLFLVPEDTLLSFYFCTRRRCSISLSSGLTWTCFRPADRKSWISHHFVLGFKKNMTNTRGFIYKCYEVTRASLRFDLNRSIHVSMHAIFGETQNCTASPASVQSLLRLPATFGCFQNWKWRSKESGSTTSDTIQSNAMRELKAIPKYAFKDCFNATVRMTNNSTNAEIWWQVGYLSDTPRIYVLLFILEYISWDINIHSFIGIIIKIWISFYKKFKVQRY